MRPSSPSIRVLGLDCDWQDWYTDKPTQKDILGTSDVEAGMYHWIWGRILLAVTRQCASSGEALLGLFEVALAVGLSSSHPPC